MRASLLTFAIAVSTSLAGARGRAATYTGSAGSVSQTLTMRRLSATEAEFSLKSVNPKARCADSLSGEARQTPLASSAKPSKGDFSAEEYVYQKGSCKLTFRVDMESATMVKVVSACPERRKTKCPLEIPTVLKLQR